MKKKIVRISDYNFDRSTYVRFDANEKSDKFDQNFIKKIKNLDFNYLIQAYPSNKIEFLKLLSRKEKIKKENITFFSGIEIGLKYIFDVFNDSKRIITIYPTYGMLNVYSKIYNLKLIKINENKIQNLTKNKFFKKKDIVYIANPNQPSGNYYNIQIIKKLIKICIKKNLILILDEAYIDFTDHETLVKKYYNNKNIIILKTFSKSFGFAGLRVGYAISHENNINFINSIKPNYDTSALSLAICTLALKQKNFLKKNTDQIKKIKKFVIKFCTKKKYVFKITEANFFYLFFKKEYILKICNKLKKKKYPCKI